MQNFKYYYQMDKETFLKCYKLTKEDNEAIKDSVERLHLDYDTAKRLRLHKVQEDSRYQDPEQVKILNKHIKDMEERIRKMSENHWNRSGRFL